MTLRWEELTEGLELEPFTDEPVSRTDIVRYQGASGDLDAAHHDEEIARSHGYDSVFSMGLLHAGILSVYAVKLFGADNVRRFRVRFRDVVWPGDELTYSGTVTRKYEHYGEHRVDLSLACSRGERSVILGEATFVIAPGTVSTANQ